MFRKFLIALAIINPNLAFPEGYDWRYIPFFDHPEVQECAEQRAKEWAEAGPYSVDEILDAAEPLNGLLPELTKTSDRDMAHLQIGAMSRAWRQGQANLRPGFHLHLHQYGYGLVVTCTFDVFDRHYASN